jgi:hypothetical protein
MEIFPNGKQDKVVAETFRLILRAYLRRPEAKSLTPDGTPCVADTHGLLRRASVVAGEIVPVGKEIDRHLEQGEQISVLDFHVLEYRDGGTLAIADLSLRDKAIKFGVRGLMRLTRLSQKTIYAVIRGHPVRSRTLARLKQAIRA